ncbi:pyridine nucleotide-disulfide oxidoreductase domain-containing protein 1-like [Watersipora subatra]|uniref:pyridine nucleotide-disulfide oxidoreductase domain-containing protein 1-like n=1 Tax=Watersipora subatra TaxID=2589382 RepID=UPI00355C1139
MAAKRATFVVIGGGIAGVTCAETLGYLSQSCDDVDIVLVSASTLIKAVVNHHKFGQTLESMDVAEKAADILTRRFPNITVKHGKVKRINADEKTVVLSNGSLLSYDKLCIATGATPKKLSMRGDANLELSIRDTESVAEFQGRLKTAKRVVVVGNGGIATELVYEIKSCEMVWCVKHKSISAAFFDGSAAQFFLPHLQDSKAEGKESVHKRWKYGKEPGKEIYRHRGNALGPDWANSFLLSGAKNECPIKKVKVEYEVEAQKIMTHQTFLESGSAEATSSTNAWPVYIELTNGCVYGSDVVVNATGVVPSCDILFAGKLEVLDCSEDGGLFIDTEMRTNIPDVYAAGDIVDTSLWQQSSQWFQMRLWTQAKQMGCYAAKCMFNHLADCSVPMDFCFEIFSHVTKFFGFKVVLLGLYNAQGMDPDDYVVHLRCTKGEEYVKVVMENGRMVGAVLIGDTDLEETFENLILNRLDISHIENSLLDSDIDIEDYFD